MSYTNTLAHLRITADWDNHVNRKPPSRGGIDYGANVGTPIPAPCDGRLENIPNNGTGGHTATFHHTGGLGKGWRDQYMHLSKFAEPGNYKAGDIIGWSGGAKGAPGAGSSTGPHIHHHLIKPDGTRVDPRRYVTGAAPAPATLSAPVGDTITVQPGDSYWAIAKRVWGGSTATINDNMHRLVQLNGNKRLFAGDTVILRSGPSAAEVAAQQAKAAAEAAAAKAKAEAEAAAVKVKEEQAKAAAAEKAIAEAAAKVAAEQAAAEVARKAAAKEAAAQARREAAARKKEEQVAKQKQQEELVAALPAQDLGVIITSPKARKVAYASYSAASLVATNTAVAFASLQIDFPAWLVVTLAIIGNLATPFAALAIANAPKKR